MCGCGRGNATAVDVEADASASARQAAAAAVQREKVSAEGRARRSSSDFLSHRHRHAFLLVPRWVGLCARAIGRHHPGAFESPAGAAGARRLSGSASSPPCAADSDVDTITRLGHEPHRVAQPDDSIAMMDDTSSGSCGGGVALRFSTRRFVLFLLRRPSCGRSGSCAFPLAAACS